MIIRRLLIVLMSLGCTFARADDGEIVPANEEADITRAVQTLEAAGPNENQLDHGKIHGCLHGQFGILGGLDPNYAQTIFKNGLSAYVADVRFANLSARGTNDQTPDLLSVSIKLYRVNGRMILSDPGEIENQDFVFVNSPAFSVANVAEFLNGEHPKASPAQREAVKEVVNPLEPRYWSQTPSKFGKTQAKFSLVPCSKGAFASSGVGTDRLRDNMVATMRAHPACFDFQVQLRNKPAVQPIEKANVVWDEAQAPFVSVARLWIKSQSVRTGPDCDKLSFTPWHSLSELRPLGGISRLREAAFRGVARPRVNLDGQAQN